MDETCFLVDPTPNLLFEPSFFPETNRLGAVVDILDPTFVDLVEPLEPLATDEERGLSFGEPLMDCMLYKLPLGLADLTTNDVALEGDRLLTDLAVSMTDSVLVVAGSHGLTAFHRSNQLHPHGSVDVGFADFKEFLHIC